AEVRIEVAGAVKAQSEPLKQAARRLVLLVQDKSFQPPVACCTAQSSSLESFGSPPFQKVAVSALTCCACSAVKPPVAAPANQTEVPSARTAASETTEAAVRTMVNTIFL